MFYFLQKIQLKGREGYFIFVKELNGILIFKHGNGIAEFEKESFPKDDVIELYESVKLFGRTPIKRVLRAIN